MTFLNFTNTSIENVSPGFLTGGVISNAIDLSSPDDTDLHTQASHVWLSGGPLIAELEFDQSYDLSTFLFWNYFTEQFDVDTVEVEYFDASGDPLGVDQFEPSTGPNPSEAETFALDDREGVASVRMTFDGSNGNVDFQNVGFVGTPTASPNQPPVATDDLYTIAQDTQLSVSAPGVFGNDSDPDGTIVTANLVSATSDPVALMFVDDGSFDFTPAPGFTGTETFQYEAVDDDAAVSNVATVTIEVVGDDVNAPPVAVDDIVLSEGTSTVFSVIDNDVDPDGTVVDATVVDGPQNGFLVDEPGGGFIYGPDVDLDPTSDSFTYVAIDDDGAQSNVATVTITFDDAPPCTIIDGTQPSETFVFAGGLLEINNFDTDDIARDETTSDTLVFTFDGTVYELNDVQEVLDFAALIESDGVGATDAAYDGDGDLALILSRNEDGTVADGIVLTDVIEPADAPGGDGLTVEALAAVSADMFDAFADENDVFCAFGPADEPVAA